VPVNDGHVEPEGVQTFCTLQPPPEQALPGQLGWPAPPHEAHTSLTQADPPPHCRPAQHC
jgi:hypothetical protein